MESYVKIVFIKIGFFPEGCVFSENTQMAAASLETTEVQGTGKGAGKRMEEKERW